MKTFTLITLVLFGTSWGLVLALQKQDSTSSSQKPQTTVTQIHPISNTTARLDLIEFTSSPDIDDLGISNPKLMSDKCNKNGSNKRCQKFREKEKHARLGSINEIWGDTDMLQHPIDEEPRRMDRALGEMCLYSSDCVSGCCMLDRETKIRSCQPKAIQGEKCTTAQIKADLYVDVCPCEAGDNFCVFPGEFCSK